MSDAVLITLITTGGACVGALLAWAGARFSARQNARADVDQARIESSAVERSDLLKAMTDRLRHVESRVDLLEEEREQDSKRIHAMNMHIFALSQQIISRQPPPPVAPPIPYD